jgi:hypothetical protein
MATPIDVHRVRELVDRGAQVVEVLPEPEYREEHVRGAINPAAQAPGRPHR